MNSAFFIKSSFLNSSHLMTDSFKKINHHYPFFILLDEDLLPSLSFLYKNDFGNIFISCEEHSIHFFNHLLSNSVDSSFDDTDIFNLFLSTLKNKYDVVVTDSNHLELSLSFCLNDSSLLLELKNFIDNFFLDSNFSTELKGNTFTVFYDIKISSFIYLIHNETIFNKIFFIDEFDDTLLLKSSSFHIPYYTINTLLQFDKRNLDNLSNFFNKNK